MTIQSAASTPATARSFRHPALFYRGAVEYLTGTLTFVRAGLRAHDPVAVAVPEPNLSLLRDALGDSAREVELMDMREVGRNPGGIIPLVLRRFADAHVGHQVRIIGEPIWASRSVEECAACAQNEALINLAFAGRVATILCPYDVGSLSARVLADAAATHPVILDATGATDSADYAPERVMRTYNVPLPEPDGAPVTLTFDRTNLSRARELVVEHARRAGMLEERVPDVELAVHELAANTLAYGGGIGVLRIWIRDAELICEVCDTGFIADPLAGRRPVEPDTFGGRGLLVVNQLADLVRRYTRPGRTTTRIHFVI